MAESQIAGDLHAPSPGYARRVTTRDMSGRLADRIDRTCDSEHDARALRVRALDELRAAIQFDAYVWLVTDPVTAVGSAPLADVPCLPELPRLVRLKYLTKQNRWTALTRSGVGVALLTRDTDGERSRSLVWRELLSRYAIGDVASTVFADRFGCWGFLDLWRRDERKPFDDDDAALLAGILPRLTRALRESQAATFVSPAVADRSERGPVVVLLDDELAIGARTAAADGWLQLLLPVPEGRAPIPASVYNVAAQLIAAEQGIDASRPLARVHLADGLWVTLRAARLATDRGEPGSIAVTIEEASPADRLDIFGRAYALTERETELLGHLARGADTRETAEAMFLSDHTVQDHLKSIFAKTADHSRRSLLSRALGTRL